MCATAYGSLLLRAFPCPYALLETSDARTRFGSRFPLVYFTSEPAIVFPMRWLHTKVMSAERAKLIGAAWWIPVCCMHNMRRDVPFFLLLAWHECAAANSTLLHRMIRSYITLLSARCLLLTVLVQPIASTCLSPLWRGARLGSPLA